MKRIFIGLLALATMGVFAETVSFEGSLLINNRIRPELTVGATVYQLIMPRHLVANLDDGENVKVTGEESAYAPTFKAFPDNPNGAKFIVVSTMEARGQEVDVAKFKSKQHSTNSKNRLGQSKFEQKGKKKPYEKSSRKPNATQRPHKMNFNN